MVTRRIRSEYMKKFKDPKWETYSKCYEEMLKYRLGRRLLEHSHNPWFWGGFGSDSDGSGSPSPAAKNKVEPLVVKDGCCTPARRTPEHRETTPPPRAPSEPEPPIPPTEERRIPPTDDVEPRAEDAAAESAPPNAGQACVSGEAGGGGETEEGRTSRAACEAPNPPDHQGEQQQPAAQPRAAKPCRKPPKLRGPLRRPREANKENRHPFALYASGEQQADLASRKTYNVCPAASTNEIHASALRAKTQREVERQMQTQRANRRTASATAADQTTKTKAAPDFDPWVTEYMRNFSARSR